MPLFMYISGFVSYKTEYKWNQIGRRVLQLVIPFVAWAMLGMTLSTDFNWNWLVRPDNGLWFLWVLFWIGVLQILFSKLARKINIAEEYIFMTVCLVLLGVMVVNKLAFGFHLIAWYLPFYILGSLFRKYEVRLSPILDKSRLPLVVLYITGGYFWMRNESPTFMHTNSQLIIFGYKFLIGIIGCLCFMSIFRLWNGRGLIISEIGGGMTLGIYAIHQTVIRYTLESNKQLGWGMENLTLWVQVLVLFIITCLSTFLIYFIFNKTVITRKLFLGR